MNNKIKLDKWDQQIILIAKGHGKNENRLQGIQFILSEAYGLDIEYITDEIIYRFLWGLVYKLKINTQVIIENLFQDSWTGERKTVIDKTHINKKLISEISLIQVKDDNYNTLIELIPDYTLLNNNLC